VALWRNVASTKVALHFEGRRERTDVQRIRIGFLLYRVGAALGILVSTSLPSYAQIRLEMRVVESETLSTSQFLTGTDHGKPVALAGELRIPGPGTDKLNTKTGAPFTLNDPCMERGTTIAYDEAATTATVKAVKDLLTATPAVAMKH